MANCNIIYQGKEYTDDEFKDFLMGKTYDRLPESFKQDVLQGLTSELSSILFEDRNLLDALEQGNKKVDEVFKKLRTNIENFYTVKESGKTLAGLYGSAIKLNPSNKDQLVRDYLKVKDSWQLIKYHWNDFIKDLVAGLGKTKIKTITDENGNVSIEDLDDLLEENEKSASDWVPDALTYNVKQRANPIIRFLLSTLSKSKKNDIGQSEEIRDQSIVNLPKLANYGSIFNHLLHESANLNSLEEIWPKLLDDATKGKRNIDADTLNFLNKIDFTQGFTNKSLPDIGLSLMAESALVKWQPQFFQQVVNDQNETFVRPTVINTKSVGIKNGWVDNMKSSSLVNVSGRDFTFKNPGKSASLLSFANKLGIDITTQEWNGLSEGKKRQFNEQFLAIEGLITNLAKVGKKVGVISGDSVDFDARLTSLAELYVKHISGEDTEAVHSNIEGKQTSSFVLNNAFSSVLNDANSSKDLEEFLKKQPTFTDIFKKDSTILNNKIFRGGKFTKPVEMGIVEGRQQAYNSVATSAMSPGERVLYEFNNNIYGISYALVPADNKNEYANNPGNFVNPDTFFSATGRQGAVDQSNAIMYKYLQTEVDLAKDFKQTKARNNLAVLRNKLGDRVRGNSLRFFLDLLPKQTVDSIHSDVIDGGKSLESIFPKEALVPIMQAHILEAAKATINDLVSSQIWSYNPEKGFKLNGVDKNFLNKYNFKGTWLPEKDVLAIVGFRERIYMIGNIEQFKIGYGDPAMYKNVPEVIKRAKSFLGGVEHVHVDEVATDAGLNQAFDGHLNKAHGEIELEAKDPGYTPFKNYANTVTAKDVIVKSSSSEALHKEIGKLADPYDEITEADAQGIHHSVHYRELLYKSGFRFTAKQEKAWQWHMAYERVKEAEKGYYEYTNPKLEKADKELIESQPLPDTGVTFLPQKYKASGSQFKDGVSIPFIHKYTLAPMFYQWVEGTQNEDLYRSMRDNGIDYIPFESAHKVGISVDSLVDMYNEDGKFNTAALKTATLQQVPHTSIGIQVETSSKNKNTEGTQLKPMATSDLYSNGIPLDYIEKFKGDEISAAESWNALSESEKDKSSYPHVLAKRYTRIIKELANKRVDDIFDRFGIKEEPDGEPIIPDKTKVAAFILKEAKRQDLPDNVTRGLEINEKGQFTTPLEANVRFKDIRGIIYSLINKNVLRSKVNGGPKTVRAVTGFEKNPRKIDKEGKASSSELPFYKKGEDGKTQPAGAYLPYYFGEEVRNKLQEKHNFKTEQGFLDHLHGHLMKTQEGRDLLSFIGFRIPLQNTNSIDSIITHGFLPQQMGDVIVKPSETTAKTGEDMDNDKTNTYTYNFGVDEEGHPFKIKLKKIDTNDEKQLDELYSRTLSGKRIKWEAYQKDFGNFVNKSLGEVLEEAPEEPNYVPSREEYISRYKGKSYYQVNSIDALENEQLDTLRELMALPEKYKALITPDNTDYLENISKSIVKSSRPNEVEKEQPTYSPLLDSQYMSKKRGALLASKRSLAISAVSQTFRALSQLGGVIFTKSPVIRFPHNQLEGKPTLSAVKNVKGDVISSINSQVTSGSADATKKDFLSDMNVNKDTVATFLMMTGLGIDPESTALLLNQPAVKEFLRLKNIYRTVPAINREVKKKYDKDIFTEVAKKFAGPQVRNKINQSLKPKQYSNKDMRSMLETFSQGKSLTNPQKIQQMQLLDDYLNYKKMSGDLYNFQQAFNWATERLGDPNLIRRKLILYANRVNIDITSVDKLLSSSFVGGYKDNVLKMASGFDQLFSVEQGEAGKVLDDLAQDIYDITKYEGGDSYQKYMLRATSSVVDSVIQTKSELAGASLNSWIPKIMTGPNSVANWVYEMQEHDNMVLANNPFLKAVRTNRDPREGYAHSIYLKEKDFDPITSNKLTSALADLKNDNTIISLNGVEKKVSELYPRIIYAGILQSGTQNVKGSWAHLIPNNDYAPRVTNALNAIDDRVSTFYSNLALYRTGWDDDVLVPPVPKIWVVDLKSPDEGSYQVPLFHHNAFYDKLGAPKGSMLALSTWEWKDTPVAKIVDYTRDDKGKILDKIVRTFRQVKVWDIEKGSVPANIKVGVQYDDGKFGSEDRTLFTEINKWRDRNSNEYYDDRVNSAFKSNPTIKEYTDEQIIAAAFDAKVAGTDRWDEINYPFEEGQETNTDGSDAEFDVYEEDFVPPLPSESKEVKNHSMSYKMPANENLTGVITSTVELSEIGLRTATTRSYPLGKVDDIITFEGRPQQYRITGLEQLTKENTTSPEWIKKWSHKEMWTTDHFKKVLGGNTVHIGSWQTSFEKVGDNKDNTGDIIKGLEGKGIIKRKCD